MIDPRQIKATLDNYYGSVVKVEGLENVFRCERKFKDQPYQYFYFDCSGDVESKDISDFSRHLLQKNYYSNPGYLQWNFYLAFLIDKKVSSETKRKVEHNEDFARKFLIEVDNLNKWLDRVYNVNRPKSTSLQRNLGNIWREQFHLKKLDCIYSEEINEADAIDGIIKGNNLRDSDTTPQKSAIDKSKIELEKITELDAKNFREHLNFDSIFSFSDVNLVRGVNGMGKTSLLEAIEYFATGANFRETKKSLEVEGSKNVRALLEGRQEFVPTETSHSILRERDKVWYNSVANIRGNQLYKSFNRFNFFNTDAAFRLSYEADSIKSVEQALRELALGEDVNYLNREIERYQRKLEAKKKERTNKRDTHEEELINVQGNIKDLKGFKGASDKLFSELNNELKRCRWTYEIPSKEEADLEKLYVEVIRIKSFFESLLEDLEWASEFTINGLVTEKKDLDKILELMESTRSFSNEIDNTKTSIRRVNDELNKLIELKVYFDNDLLDLIGLAERISSQQSKIKVLEEQNRRFIKIDKTKFDEISEKVTTRLERLSSLVSKRKADQGNLIRQINELRDGISELETLSSSIKATGLDYVKNSDTNICPLCNHVHDSNTELLEKIKKTIINLSSSEALTNLLTQEKNLAEEIGRNENEIDRLIELDNISFKVLSDKENEIELPVSELVLQLGKEFEKINEEKNHLLQLSKVKEKGSKEGLSEENIVKLKSFFTTNFELAFEAKVIDSLIKRFSNEKKELETSLEDIGSKKKEKDKEIQKVLKNYTLNSDDQASIKNRKRLLDHYLSEADSFRKEIEFSDSENLLKIRQRILNIEESLEKLRIEIDRESKNHLQFKKFSHRADTLGPIINKLTLEINRIDTALSDIDEVLNENSEDKFLSGFFDENLETITRIFLAIHSPNEFSDIRFSDGALRIIRSDTNKEADINSISTGQRSALALSIFLTLNSKLSNEPKFIILDDPIAFIDDLNVLSFLDYLREIAISDENGKQIFFATANDDLAFLFKKKFEALGDGFKDIVLER